VLGGLHEFARINCKQMFAMPRPARSRLSAAPSKLFFLAAVPRPSRRYQHRVNLLAVDSREFVFNRKGMRQPPATTKLCA